MIASVSTMSDAHVIRRGAFLEDSGAPFRGRPVLTAIRGITPFLYPIAFCGLIVGCN